jgi:penicillin-binding protein 2
VPTHLYAAPLMERSAQLFHMHARRRRSAGAIAIIVLVLGWLGFSFFQTQVLNNTAYALQSEANRLRPVTVPPPRGAILDRYGELIAGSVPGYTLMLLPASRDSLRTKLRGLAPILNLAPERIESLLERQRRTPHQPLVVSSNLTFEQVSAIEEQRARMPGILIDTSPKRYYPAGPAVAHLVGYLSEIGEKELDQPEFAGYRQGRYIGKAGLERQYELMLGGQPGTRFVEQDALGRVRGEFAPRPQLPPVPGQDLHLYVDAGLQEYMRRIFPAGKRGAMAAVEPRTGHVLALFSTPAYDPNDFAGGISGEQWTKLATDPERPLLPRALAGLYAPGSTFKLATAAAALELGVLDPLGYMPQACRGSYYYGNRFFRCWQQNGSHGFLNLPDAIRNSCNVYFYQVGLRVGLEQLIHRVNRMGFSSRTGIDLPNEVAGVYPNELDWYRRRLGYQPRTAEVLSLAIGQGPNDQTVLTMAQFFAALAGDGRVGPLRVAVEAPVDENGGVDLGISKENLAWLRDGLRRTVAPGGTAWRSSLEHWELSGKTGTAQNPHGNAHGWFVGMAGPWGEEPEIVVAAIVEAGESGSGAAAPLVAKAADYYLRRKHHMPTDTIQTYNEYVAAGRSVTWVYR